MPTFIKMEGSTLTLIICIFKITMEINYKKLKLN